jgi:hypothetical protein
MTADAASTGTYVNSDGKFLDLNETGVLQIDDQAAANLRRGLPNPVKEGGDSNRSWVSKIFQQTALNVLLDEREAGAVRYVDRGDHEAQVPADDVHGRTMLHHHRDGRVSPLRDPRIVDSKDLETIYQKLTGKQRSFSLSASIEGTSDAPVVLGNQIIGTADDLGRLLQEMQANGNHALVDVDVRNNPFWQTSGYGAAGGAGGEGFRGLGARGHVVFVKEVALEYVRKPDGSVQFGRNEQPIIDVNKSKVAVLNSWGRAADHVQSNLLNGKDTRITLQQLYDSMNGWRPGKP